MLVGVDVGGTFTDFVAADGADVQTYKLPSSRMDPGTPVMAGIRALGGNQMAHGTTVATNAVLEGRGAKVAFVTTSGFEDLLVIARQNRPSLYDLRITRPEPLVKSGRTFGVPERVAADGSVLRPLDVGAMEETIARIRASGAESVAVCLLFSFLHPQHERAVFDAIGDIPVSISSEVLPEFREYERASATVLDAYVKPLVDSYLAGLERSLGSPFLVMRSSGGVLRSTAVRARPIEMLLSGPAGGVAAAKVIAELLGERNVVTFDMGGTSADVSVIVDGEPTWTTEASIAGHPLAVPVVDVTSVGAGGGSIASFDAGGALRVGPESAGADPGPMCYGKGGKDFTVADADLVGGALPPTLLGGAMVLDHHAARRGARMIAAKFGGSADAVLAVQAVVRASMAGAIHLALSKRGLNPRDFSLFAFGGAGPMHAAYLARDLGIRRLIVPFLPGAFSAYGILASDLRLTYGRTRVMLLSEAGTRVESILAEMTAAARSSFASQGLSDQPVYEPSLDLRYAGQSYEVNVPVKGDVAEAFHRRHEGLFGYAARGEPIELVTVRLAAVIARPKPIPRGVPHGVAVKGSRKLLTPEGRQAASIYRRPALQTGFVSSGPAVVEEDHATTVVPPGCDLRVLAHGILQVEVPP